MELRVISHLEDELLFYVNGTLSGFSVRLLLDLTFATNFSFAITIPMANTDSYWQNGTVDFFEEFAGALTTGETDLDCCTYYYVPQRAKQAILLLPLWTEKFRGFFVQPGINNQNRSGIFFAPFGLMAAIIFYSITLISVILTSFIYWKGGIRKLNNPRGFTHSFISGSWWIIIAYSLKNYAVPSQPTSLQITAIPTSLFFYIMNLTYFCFLLSILTPTLNPVRTFDDLLTFGFSIYANPSVSQTITRNPKYSKHYKDMKGPLNSFRLAANGGHVYVDHSDAFSYFEPLLSWGSADICGKLSVVPFPTGVSSGLYLRPNASQQLRETLNQGIARMSVTGLLHKFNRGYHVRSLASCLRKTQKYIKMDLNHVSPLFKALGGMFLCTLIVFLAELLTRKRITKNIQRSLDASPYDSKRESV